MAEYALKRFENVRENEALPSFDLKVTRTHIIKYVGAGGDFQPIHHDEAFAVSSGLPSIFANGLMHGGMLAKVVTDWAGYGVLKQYKIRFTGIVWPGDTLFFSGNVSHKKQENKSKSGDVHVKRGQPERRRCHSRRSLGELSLMSLLGMNQEI